MKRPRFDFDKLACALEDVTSQIRKRLQTKGPQSFISKHEILGIITEEYLELVEAVRTDNSQEVEAELLDLAVAAVLSMTAIKQGATTASA